ncbi:protein kinase domain-containing protein [Aporhodopirellula aestuarii]|uniref:Leucine-rich repeat and WD repeat-containing protein 1 n=1 Tax=Aporhodopirellula aestuarii TaxID=2950107 RepID=A0ABT0U782_9BACT|nr:protein kinase [Aporhodopirellula aestuarii]MCM2372772.1 protein kinase [Aporhodopirellula aestuarii]
MNLNSGTCPSKDDLRSFLTGHLSVVQTDQLASHIESCLSCQSQLEQWDDAEVSIDAILDKRSDIAFADESKCDRVLRTIAARKSRVDNEPQNRQLGDYELLDPLGQGGLGMVYRARHVELGTATAVKILQPHRRTDRLTIERFEREMVALGRLDHPNIVRALDAGEEAGQHYLVMEYVDGFDLGRIASVNGRLSVADAAEVIRQAAMALSYVHRNGRIHRDIKPSNLILARDGTVKVMDLGLARVEELPIEEPDNDADDILGGSTGDLTRTHQIMGTPEYMPPEQVTDSSHVDHRADIYSLGCTFYKLLVGKSPLAASGSVTTLQQLVESLQTPAIAVRQTRPEVPEEVSDLIDRMLAKRAEDRPQSAAEIADALRPFASGANLPELAAATQSDLDSALTATRDDFSTQRDDLVQGQASAASPPDSTHRGLGIFVAAAALLLLAVVLMIVSAWRSAEGTIIVEAESDEVAELLAAGSARLEADGMQLPLRVGRSEIPARRYSVHSDPESRLKFSQSTIDLGRDQQLVLSVSRSSIELPETPRREPKKEAEIASNQDTEPQKYDWVDLISLIKPSRDIRGNDWQVVDGTLVSNPENPSMLMIPYQPPDEYRVELIATRLQNEESLALGLSVDNRPVILAIDAFPANGHLSGLIQLNNVRLPQRLERTHRGQLLPMNRPVPIVAEVRRDGQRLSIQMTVDGTPITSWRGSIDEATGVGAFPPPQPGFLFLANWTASIKVSEFRVIPLSGDGRIFSFTDPRTDRQRAIAERVLWKGGSVTILDQNPQANPSVTEVVGGFELIRQFKGHTGPVKSVAVSPDGQTAASGSGWPSGDQTIRIWDVETGEQKQALSLGFNVMSVAFSSDGRQMIAGGASPEISLWDVQTGELLREMVVGDAPRIEQVTFTPDGTSIVAITGRPGIGYALDTQTGDVIHRWDLGRSALCFAISPDSDSLAIGIDDTAVLVIDMKSGEILRQLDGPSIDRVGRYAKETYALSFSADGTRVAAAYKDRAIRVWDFESGRVVKDIRSPVGGMEEIQFALDDQHLIVTGFDGLTGLIEIETGQVVGTTPLIPGHGWSVALLSDGERILAGGGAVKSEKGFTRTGDYALRLWKLGTPSDEISTEETPEPLPTIRVDRLVKIPEEPEIVAIDLEESQWLNDSDLTYFSDLPNLQSLDLSGTGVTSSGIEQLGRSPNLRGLSLAGTSVIEIPDSFANQLPTLEKLYLQGTSISDLSVAALNGLHGLVSLDLGGTRISSNGLSQLDSLSGLRTLSVAGASIHQLNDVTPKRFPALSRLNLIGTRISRSEVEIIRKNLPETKVVSGYESVDLISLVDVDRDSVIEWDLGQPWRKQEGRLMTAERTRLSLPIELPADFDFTMTATRITEGNAPLIGFTLPGNHKFAVGFDQFPKLGQFTILYGIDGSVGQDSPDQVEENTFPIDSNEPVQIQIRVRSENGLVDIRVLRNGTQVLQWQGEPTRLGPANVWWWEGPRQSQPWIRQYNGMMAIEEMTVTPVSGSIEASPFNEQKRLANIPSLTLDLRGREMDDSKLKELLQTELPTQLYLYGPNITDESIDLLAANRQLQFLSLDSTKMTENGISGLVDLPHLDRIEFWKMPQITGDVTKSLARMPSLKHLVSKHCGLYGPGLERLHDRPITGLNLGHHAVDADVLERYVLPFQALRVLDFAGSPIDDDAIALFPRLENLTSLHLGYNQQWKGPGLESIKRIPTLRVLHLDASAADDSSLKHLAGATQLRDLILRKTSVSDDSIETLRALSGLEKLHLENTNFTLEGIQRLRAIMPQVKITSDWSAEP